PVCAVSWYDVHGFCQWLTEKEAAEGKLPKGWTYRLPTDLEWSAAAGLSDENGLSPRARSMGRNGQFVWAGKFPPETKVGNFADESFAALVPERKKNNAYINGY